MVYVGFSSSNEIHSTGSDMVEKEDVVLNSKEVAQILDLSPDTVNEFARKNILSAFKKGRQWRFRKKDVLSFKRHVQGAQAA